MPIPASEEKKLEWKNLIEEQSQSSLSANKWCRERGLRPHTFRYWKNKLASKQLQKSSFTEIKVKRPQTVSLQARGLYVRLGHDCDPQLRSKVFALFAEAGC